MVAIRREIGHGVRVSRLPRMTPNRLCGFMLLVGNSRDHNLYRTVEMRIQHTDRQKASAREIGGDTARDSMFLFEGVFNGF